MIRYDISDNYFDWLSNIVCGKRYSKQLSYMKLLEYLHSVDFRYSIPMDQNRAMDGMDLRWRFTLETDLELDLDTPCSVLEMLIALSIRCEENIMDDPAVGDRTGQWFWGMIVNLGLGSMTDTRFNRYFVEDVIERFLNREYEPDGRGGLFRIRNCDFDLREVEIWHQLLWYLDTLT